MGVEKEHVGAAMMTMDSIKRIDPMLVVVYEYDYA